MELLVEQGAVRRDKMIEPRYGICRSRRAVRIFARRGRYPVRNGFARQPAVGGRARLRTERYVRRNGIQPCLELPAARVFILFERTRIGVCDVARKCVDLFYVVAEFRYGVDHGEQFVVFVSRAP